MIKHQYREKIQAVDSLTRQGGGITKTYIEGKELPTKLRGILRLDKLGFPNLRV